MRIATVVISTDGSVARHANGFGETGPGGWAFVNHATHETRMGRVASATNNQMELRAVIEAVRSVDSKASIVIRTDSQYVRGIIGRGAIIRSDASMWREYEEVSKSRRVDVSWIKGHAGDPHNAFVDRLAGKQAKLAIAELAQNGLVSSECGVGTMAPLPVASAPVRHAAWRVRNPARKNRKRKMLPGGAPCEAQQTCR
jgi:ribonuclease HI